MTVTAAANYDTRVNGVLGNVIRTWLIVPETNIK
jgi:hypothetical protein